MSRRPLSRATAPRRTFGTAPAWAVLAALALLVAGPVAGFGLSGFSGATYTSSSSSTASVAAATDWTSPTVSLRNPGTPVSGSVSLVADASDAKSGVARVILQVLGSTGSWVSLCTVASGAGTAYTCAWDTATVADGSHSLRAVATDRAGYTTTSNTVTTTVTNRAVDGIALTLVTPGSTVRGTAPLAVTIQTGESLVTAVRLEYSVADSGTWATLCTGLVAPYACSWDTAELGDGTYTLRAVATASNTTATSPVVNGIRIDNTAPTVALVDPGSPLTGAVALVATAGDPGSGVAAVRIQTYAGDSGRWTDICTVTKAPFTCQFDTTTLADATWSFRAVATDVAGNTATSATVGGRVIDNGPQLRGVDLQAGNGGGRTGTLDTGDTLTLTYSRLLSLGSVTPGWDGSALPVTLRLRDGKLVNKSNFDDTLDVLRSGSGVGLGTVNLGRNQLSGNSTVVFAATMTAQTIVVGGTQATRVTITLLDTGDGKQNDTRSESSALVWTPSALAHDLLGRPSLTDAFTRTVTTDRYF